MKTELMTLAELTAKLTPEYPLLYYTISNFDRENQILTTTQITYKRFPEFEGAPAVSQIRRYRIELNIKDEVLSYKEI